MVNQLQKHRAEKAQNILMEHYDPNDLISSMADCMADLFHLCDVLQITYADRIGSAFYHYTTEKTPEEEAAWLAMQEGEKQ